MDEHDSFPQRVWQIVASIPEGYVTTYGVMSRVWAGSPRAARQVGGVLNGWRKAVRCPWHRGGESSWRHFAHRAGISSVSVRRYFQRVCRCQDRVRSICRNFSGVY
ncbi:protein YbaZ [Enterobacter asburiae]|uniref:Protein YbaZ n=1 Tax=Enterobacter asburiae TaxID=61645 RepID=A0A376F5R4_ENTAS|nr:protein YbaZ [Enterobacter asburiae]